MKPVSIQEIEAFHVRAVVFDLDGTLYDKKHIAWHLVVGDIRNVMLLNSERYLRKQLRGVFFGNKQNFYQRMFSWISIHRHVTFEEAEEWYFQRFMPLYSDVLHRYYHAESWAKTLVGELRERGIKTAVFSDYVGVDQRLEALGYDPNAFDFLFAAPMLGGLKPAKQVFKKVLSEMSVKASETLMIGDRDDTDGAGARAVGMSFLKV